MSGRSPSFARPKDSDGARRESLVRFKEALAISSCCAARYTMPMINCIDHVAITARDLAATGSFYEHVLGAIAVHDFEIDGQVIARQFRIGGAMVNIHQAGHGHSLVARQPTPGAIDLCFGWNAPIEEAIALLARSNVAIEEGPVERTNHAGERGLSVYFRDPDGNLLELLATAGWK
jgi:catechol 2,3-dioxygenase-like lactoylglutathione lyase family enzyme